MKLNYLIILGHCTRTGSQEPILSEKLFCNAGVYIFRKSLLKNVKNEKKIVDFSKDIIPNLIKNKKVKAILNVTKCLGFDDAQLYRKNLS